MKKGVSPSKKAKRTPDPRFARARAIAARAQLTNFNDQPAYIISAADRDTLLGLLT